MSRDTLALVSQSSAAGNRMDNRRVQPKTLYRAERHLPTPAGEFCVERDIADSPAAPARHSLCTRRWVRLYPMLRLLLVGVASVLSTESVDQAQVRLSNEDIHHILQDRVVREKKAVSIVVGLLDDDGVRVIGFGPPFKGSNLTVDGDALFEIASITKTFTTTLLADMVERGEVALNDPIAKYLPASVRVPTRSGKEITLLHLATHTSGLPREPDNLAPLWWRFCPFCTDNDRFEATYSTERMYAFLSGHTLKQDIESRSSYSNYGVALLGQILARRAGMDYETLVRTRITGPLNMHDTVITVSPEQQGRLANGYTASGKSVPNRDWSKAVAPAGSLKSTVNDLLKYSRANLGLTPSPLLPAMQRAQRPQYNMGNATRSLGLGWGLLRGLDGDILWHNGATTGYVSFMAFEPKRRTGVVVLSSSYNSIDNVNDITTIGMHLLDPVRYPLARDAKARKAIGLDAATLDAYVGEYQAYQAGKSPALGVGLELTESYYFRVTRDGTRLFVQPGELRKVEVFAETERDFFWLPQDAKDTLLLSDAQATFVRDGSGVVSQLVLHSNGSHWPARRLR